MDPGKRLFTAIVIAAAFMSLAIGYRLKANCTDRPWDGRQWSTLCANDVALLYSLQDLRYERTFPPEKIEYPALVVLLVGATAQLAHSTAGFVELNGLVAAISGIAAAASLTRLAPGHRALLFAVGPPMILYSFQNWDLLAVALAVGGLYLLFQRQMPAAAGLSLGLGAAVKAFPALLMPALVLAVRRSPGSRMNRDTLALVLGFLAGALVPNAILWLASPSAWGYFWSFQAERFPNPETSWFMVFRHLHGTPFVAGWWEHGYPRLTDIASGAAFLLITSLVVARERRRAHVRPYELALAITAIFLLTAKVFSPQYMLWLLPFLAILRLRWTLIAACFLTDLAVLTCINWYYLEVLRNGPWGTVLDVLEVTVWARYAVLIWLVITVLRSPQTKDRTPYVAVSRS
jgi:hypothetical protein